jgi:hypothetical protein
MTEPTAAALACHGMLLRLAGNVPDELLTRCRDWLAEGRLAEVAYAVTDAVLGHNVSVAADDLALLGRLLAASGADPGILTGVQPTSYETLPAFRFAPNLPEEFEDVDVQAAQRLAMTAAGLVSGIAAAHGIWQAWRLPLHAAPWPPRQVFVVEVDPDANLPALTGVLQEVLTASGAWAPQVEVYPLGAEPPRYQALARLDGELLWASTPDPGVRMARLSTHNPPPR